ncbi:hypothetical protein BpHYR1_044979 [Brachionus plicatilis]|uniref:Uncharacterized protein n=1 Tax=Brachionus plicatilis TaxID=10195 RepID=A0A3M7Q676_BRAPC|nr:hypothetical protein BpHYR1_044979 [Brachionus plicatilis]
MYNQSNGHNFVKRIFYLILITAPLSCAIFQKRQLVNESVQKNGSSQKFDHLITKFTLKKSSSI